MKTTTLPQPQKDTPFASLRWGIYVLAAWLAAWGGARLSAQELTLMPVGAMSTSGFNRNSFAWQVDYRLFLAPNFALSEAYLNEGKIAGHRRDGYATEGWVDLPLDHQRFTLAVGAGFYSYFDTEGQVGNSVDFHGTAPIASLSATAYFYQRAYFRITANAIMPSHDIKVNSLVAGVGVWLGHGSRPERWRASYPDEAEVTRNEITAYWGQSTLNTLRNEKAAATSLEYRHGLGRYFDATVAWINEGDPKVIRRNGVGVQVWPVNSFTFGHQTISVGMGLGGYVSIDHKHPQPGKFGGASVLPLISPAIGWEIDDHWGLRAVLHRVVTSVNRDSDVFLLGMIYRWGR